MTWTQGKTSVPIPKASRSPQSFLQKPYDAKHRARETCTGCNRTIGKDAPKFEDPRKALWRTGWLSWVLKEEQYFIRQTKGRLVFQAEKLGKCK